MNGTPTTPDSQEPAFGPGVVKNPHGGYHIQVQLHERQPALLTGSLNPQTLAPPGIPVLERMQVFEDCVLLVLQEGQALMVHVSDPAAAGSVVYFYHANGALWRAVPLERLNPGWVLSTYHFGGTLRQAQGKLCATSTRA